MKILFIMLKKIQYYYFKLRKEQKIKDDFIARLRCALIGEGMINEGNIYAFDYAIQHLPQKGALIEIGSFGGMSTNIICYLLRKYQKNNLFFTADPWIYEGYHDEARLHDAHYLQYMDGSNRITRKAYTDFIKEGFIRNTCFFSAENLPYTIQSFSEDFFQKWQKKEMATDVFERGVVLGGAISFAYIDGNHAFDYAKKDFEQVYQHLVSGGFILLDDSADFYHYGSAELPAFIQKMYPDMKCVLKNPNYLFQKK